jgi:hypothetical protein
MRRIVASAVPCGTPYQRDSLTHPPTPLGLEGASAAVPAAKEVASGKGARHVPFPPPRRPCTPARRHLGSHLGLRLGPLGQVRGQRAPGRPLCLGAPGSPLGMARQSAARSKRRERDAPRPPCRPRTCSSVSPTRAAARRRSRARPQWQALGWEPPAGVGSCAATGSRCSATSGRSVSGGASQDSARPRRTATSCEPLRARECLGSRTVAAGGQDPCEALFRTACRASSLTGGASQATASNRSPRSRAAVPQKGYSHDPNACRMRKLTASSTPETRR